MYIYFVISILKWDFRFSVMAQYNDDLKFGEAWDKRSSNVHVISAARYLWDNFLLNIVQAKKVNLFCKGVLGGRKWNGEGFSFCADNSIYWSD